MTLAPLPKSIGAFEKVRLGLARFAAGPGAWRRSLLVFAAAALSGGAVYGVVQLAVRLTAPLMPPG